MKVFTPAQRKEMLDVVRTTVNNDKGMDGFTWDNLAMSIAKKAGIEPGERNDAFERAGRVVRGVYPNRKQIWETKFDEVQLNHILELMLFELQFTLGSVPAPPPKQDAKAKAAAAQNDKPIPPAPPPAPANARQPATAGAK